MVDRQEQFLNSRHSRIAKTVSFWPWWQPFSSFSFEYLSFSLYFPSFFSGGGMGGKGWGEGEGYYQELGLDSLYHRHWFRKLCLFHKIYKTQCRRCWHELLPQSSSCYRTRQSSNIPLFYFKNNFYRNIFFTSSVIEWNKLGLSIRNS